MASRQLHEQAGDQGEVVAFLSEAANYPNGAASVSRIDTHAAVIFLVGERAYKMKRQVRFSFLDFSTLEKREKAIRAELALNRPNAPDIYLETVAVRRRGDGSLAIAGEGDPVEWLLVMRRFDERQTLDRLSEAQGLSGALLDSLSDAVLASHRQATVLGPPFGGAEAVGRLIEENRADFAAWPEVFSDKAVEALLAAAATALQALQELLDRRRSEGKVRHCHGDLHLANIVLWHGRPVLFDCIEFSEDIAGIDVFYDLAFLIMDLVHRGLLAEANRVLNRYLLFSDDHEGLAALPLFLSLRAAVRAKVSAPAAAAQSDAAEAARLREQAKVYFQEADDYLVSCTPRLVAVGGLSGSGKSSLAARLSPCMGPPPGAAWLRSDSLRKVLLGKRPEERLGAEAYAPDVTERVYGELRDRAERTLAAGRSVLIDAVHGRAAERDALRSLAERCSVAFQGLWLDAPLALRSERVSDRKDDASDADAAIAARQESYELGAIDWTRLDASLPLAALAQQARALLGPSA